MPTGDPSTQRHDLRALTRLWFEEVWNKGWAEVIDRMIAAGNEGPSEWRARPLRGL